MSPEIMSAKDVARVFKSDTPYWFVVETPWNRVEYPGEQLAINQANEINAAIAPLIAKAREEGSEKAECVVHGPLVRYCIVCTEHCAWNNAIEDAARLVEGLIVPVKDARDQAIKQDAWNLAARRIRALSAPGGTQK
jgi:hypothetical protein